MVDKTNLEQALDSIKRIGSFSEGEKIALIKGLRQALFPGNWSLDNVTDEDILQYQASTGLWVNGALTFPTLDLDDLGDTNVPSPTDTYVLTYDSGTGKWVSSAAPVTTVNGEAGDVVVGIDHVTPTTTKGDLIVEDGSNAIRLGVGSDGQVLEADSAAASGVKWATPASGFADPMTTRGDVIVRDATNTTARLAVGTADQVLQSDGTDIGWATLDFEDVNPMTTNGDIIVQAGGVGARLGVGSEAQVLTVSSGAPVWATPASGFADPTTTRGDIIYKDSGGTTTRLPAGANGYVLTSDGTDISWQAASASSFIGLSDTPSAYTAAAGQWLRVNATADGVEFVSTSPVTQVTGSAPISSSGGTTPDLSMLSATAARDGYMTSTYAAKLDAIENGADVTDATNVADAVEAFGAATALDTTDDWVIVVDGVAKLVDAQYVESYLESNLAFNNYTHPNHTGQVTSTGDGATQLNYTAISSQTLTTSSDPKHEVLIQDGFALYKMELEDIIDVGGVDGQHVFIQSTTPTANAIGDIWIDIS